MFCVVLESLKKLDMGEVHNEFNLSGFMLLHLMQIISVFSCMRL